MHVEKISDQNILILSGIISPDGGVAG